MHRSQLAGPVIDRGPRVPDLESDAIVDGLKRLPASAAGRIARFGRRGVIDVSGEGWICAVPAIHPDHAARANSWS